MKKEPRYTDVIIVSFGIGHILLGFLELSPDMNQNILSIMLFVVGLCLILYVILTVRDRYNMENKLQLARGANEELKYDNDKLVNKVVYWKGKYETEPELLRKQNEELIKFATKKEQLKPVTGFVIHGEKLPPMEMAPKETKTNMTSFVADELTKVFAEDPVPETQGYVCPKCGEPMTRHTKSIVFCDNIECTRKQWRKDKLEKGEYDVQ